MLSSVIIIFVSRFSSYIFNIRHWDWSNQLLFVLSFTDTTKTRRIPNVRKYQTSQPAILNRAGLEAAACNCYAIVKKEYEKIHV